MKLLIAAAAVFLAYPAFAQAPNSSAKNTVASPITQRAVIVFATRPQIPNQDAGYHIFVGDQGYHAAGVGPKTAGIYDVEVYPSKEQNVPGLIIVHSYHPGGAIHGKQLDERFRLQIISPYDDAPKQTGYTGKHEIDGRRLLIFYVSGTKSTFNALAVDNATGKEIWFRAVPRTPTDDGLGLGIYDFRFVPSNKPTDTDLGTLNVYQIKRDGTVVTHPLQVTEITKQ